MTGPEHYLFAELLADKAEQDSENAASEQMGKAQVWATLAVAHAQLATAAAVALQAPGGDDAGMYVVDVEAWEEVASARSANT